ncbi:MAG: 6,7-dimethyl-8-ribityllumazine synthase [Calditrichaeota bacterium]|nr:6,7-dimethyl-8-ribityllumazine synthase [Calditrichota bacterium]MCB9368705.1 6,7-dimethyl-8-ribityllumazine synthase [Calditrichota bacterium]
MLPHLPAGRVVILRSRYHENITGALLNGALAELKEQGISESRIDVVELPGAFELPAAAAKIAKQLSVDAVIALGAVVRGETPHFDFICQACAQGLSRVAEQTGKPVTFGVITANTVEQAFERAGGRVGNKGQEAARAALELFSSLKRWEQQQASGS